MENYICTTCGTQFRESATPPDHCPICEDERQYVDPDGQQWTTLKKLRKNHKIVFQKKESGLYGIGTTPEFGIGQRALLVKSPQGNLLWDCISLIDDATVDLITGLGGVDAIAISHPHYYSAMVEWSRAFGDIPVYLHLRDREWVQRPHENITYWEGSSKQLYDGLTLYNTGGHFAGGTVLHWAYGSGGKGALLSGDILQVVPDRRHVSFMYSYPNHIPLNGETVEEITATIDPLNYERIYGAWWDRNIMKGGKKAVQNSAERYLAAIQ
ncbi:MBL fold metallo-hydrolase [Fodinibius sediminis]|nr:MBL fold metallo-hydrolase [Fodinibius sediminis]